jgi:hypothetical protein
MKVNLIFVGILVTIAFFSLSSCRAALPASTPTSLPTAPAPVSATPTSSGMGNVNPDPKLANYILQSRTDLATRLNVAPESITVKQAQALEWPDGSLGCPQRGVFYVQVVSPGYLILLEANGKEYEYHGDRNKIFLCEKT